MKLRDSKSLEGLKFAFGCENQDLGVSSMFDVQSWPNFSKNSLKFDMFGRFDVRFYKY